MCSAGQEFILAAERGDFESMVNFMNTGMVNCNMADSHGRTALHFAVAHGSLDAVKYLVGMKANVSAMDVNGNSPLHLASLGNKSAIVSFLLQSGVNPSQTDAMGKTPIDWIGDRIRHMKGAIYHRRLQYADDEEITDIRQKLLNELQGMINDITQWMQTGGSVSSEGGLLLNQLQNVHDKMNQSDSSFDLEELDSLFTNLSV